MAATVHHVISKRSWRRAKPCPRVNALPTAEAGGHGCHQTELTSEAVFWRRIRFASLTAVPLGLWVAILWVLASLISVVRG